MANIINSLYDMGELDDFSRKDTSIHKIHPLAKFLTTIVYLFSVISFGKYEINGLMPFVFYPIIIFAVAEIPVGKIFKRLLIVSPFILGIGIVNLFFDKVPINIAGVIINSGWITFLSILIKSILAVTASILLIATTGMENLGAALRMIRVPKIFVMQLLLTYRYISILIEEVSRMMMAYSLRAPEQKGVHMKHLGSFAGQLLLRTYDRAERVYDSMNLRGFTGEYNTGVALKIKFKDCAYFILWSLFFIIARNFNIPMLIGTLLKEVIK